MWIEVGEGIGYFKGAVNQGVIRSNQGAILIDTGLDKSAGKKLIRLLDQLELTLVAIINTHSHADHIGGNRTLLDHYGEGVKVYAPAFEESAIRNPIWEPIYLYGGAVPGPELQNKFLMAPSSPVDVIIEPGELIIDGITLQVIPLFGHAYGQIGIGYKNVLFAADAFFGEEVLDKHPIPFLVDTEQTFTSFESLQQLPYQHFIPGHGEIVSGMNSLAETIQANRDVHEKVISLMIEVIDRKCTLGELMEKLCLRLGIMITSVGSYLLYKTAVKSHLTYLMGKGIIIQEISENRWLWYKS